jgi:hypothetical protein
MGDAVLGLVASAMPNPPRWSTVCSAIACWALIAAE